MGVHWLHDLPDIVDVAGLRYELWDGWETRARSSGGYDQVWAVFVHHTASPGPQQSDCEWEWDASSGDQPIGAINLGRDGTVIIGAAGATNCQGKGGPWQLSQGTIPLDKGNAYGIAIEAGNNGVGEPWPTAQTDAYVTLVAALCDAYRLDPQRDVLAHFEWVQPSCPGRKIDPAGPSPWAGGADSWTMDEFRIDVDHCGVVPIPPTPEPEPQPPPTGDDDMLFICKVGDVIYVGDGVRSFEVPAADEDTLEANIKSANRWHQPARAGLPLVKSMADIVTINAGQRDLLVGRLD